MRGSRIGVALAVLLCTALAFLTVTVDGGVQTAAAQEVSPCRALAQHVIDTAKQVCSGLAPNSACYGHQAVQAQNGNRDIPAMSAEGQQVSLTDIESLTTSAADLEAGTWGVAVLNIQADLPAASSIQAILFGGASLISTVRPGADQAPTLPVKTFDELPVTLRAGASPNFPQVIRFTQGTPALADGRNAKANWVRVRVGDAVGWAPLNQIRLEGDVNALTMLDDRDIMPAHLYQAPMQAFTLSSALAKGKPVCAEAASGLMLQANSEDADRPANLIVNGAALRFANATLMLRAVPGDALEVMALTGSAVIKAYGVEVNIEAGDSARVRIGGADKLTAIAAPKKAKYGFAALEGAPAGLLPEELPCMAGVLQGDKRVAARSGPGVKEFTSLFYLSPAQVYRVEGWWTDSNNAPWWKLSNPDKAENWVDQAAVRTLGACATVEKVEPGTFAASGSGDPGAAGVPGGGGFAPTTRTIWNAEVGTDQLVGECKLGALNYCAQMVAITPRGSGLMWKGQEIKTYPLTRIRENVYVYNGRNGLGDANIKLVLVFNSPTSLTMTQTLVLDADPKCQHINTFTATLR